MIRRIYAPLIASTVVCLFALVVVSCAPKSVVTPEGQRAWTATEVLVRVHELQQAAIQANSDKALSDADAIVVVKFTTSAAATLKQAPVGWPTTVKAGWAQVKANISAAGNKTLSLVFGIIDGVLGGLQ